MAERWKQAVDNRNVVGVLSTDMSKAFHSLNATLLINKLSVYGFSNNSIALMRSYFTNRKNRLGSVKKQQVIGTLPQEDVPRDRPSGLFFGMLSKAIYTSPLMKTGYLCMQMTTNCFQWRRQLTGQQINL